MEAPDRWLYEYCIVRYLPFPERGEFVNIGLIMLCKRRKWLKGKIFLDSEKLKSLNPNVDVKTLKCQASLFENMNVPDSDLPVEEKFRWLVAEKSACIRVSPSHPGIVVDLDDKAEEKAEDILEKEFRRLFNLLVL